MDETTTANTFDDAELEAAWAEEEDAMVEDGAHETEDQPEDAQQQADQPAAPETETPPEQSAEEERADQPQLFTLKYRGEQLQVTQDEMVALAQKGRDYDTVRQERDQLLQYRQEADQALELVRGYAQRNGMTVGDYLDYCRRRELMSQGINEQTANAQIAVEKQQAALQRQNAEAAAARRQQEAEADQARQRQEAQRKDFAAFLGAYPGVKTTEIPKEVWEKVAQGESLVSAYTMHRNRQLEAELAAERQNRKNQQRTTGSLSDPAGGDRQDDIDRWWNEDD